MPESTRRQIGKYQIQAELGRGGFGVVYSAYDPTVGRPVAVKVLTAIGDVQLLTRFKNEAASAGNLRHRNIVTIYDYGDDDGLPYIVMELLEGEDLNQIIAAKTPMTLLQKVSIMIQVADGLRSAHRAGVVHRDVKPANIRLLPDGTVKLMDFGIARLVAGTAATRLTRQGHVIGTLYYMAPEQVLGEEVDALSDIFSYGSTYYELLTGKHPFQGLDPRSVFHKITAEDPEPIRNLVPDCPEALERIVNRTLQKDRDLRYQSLRDVQVDSEPILIELRQERAESLVIEAKRLYNATDLQSAQGVLGEVFDLDPANREARHLRDTIESQLLDRLIRPKVEALLTKADEALSARRFEDAIESFEAALRLDRDNPALAERLRQARELLTLRREMGLLIGNARKLFSKKDLEGALEVLLRVIERDPANPEAQQLLDEVRTALNRREMERAYGEKLREARALLQANSFDDAARLVEELEPEFAEREEAKDLASQIRFRRETFERQQELKKEIDAIRELLARDQFEESIKRVELLMNRFPEEIEPTRLFILAHKELAAHRKTQALDKLETELNLLVAGGHFGRALGLISRSLNTYPSDARLLEAQRKVNESWEHQKRELAIRQVLEKSERLLAHSQFEEAIEVLETAVQQYSDDSRFDQPLAAARDALAQRRLEEAIAEAARERAGRIHEDIANSRALAAQNRFEEGLQLLRSSLNQFPDEPELAQELTSTEEARKARQREEGIVSICAQAQGKHDELLFEPALEIVGRGLAEYGQDLRLVELRDRISKAKADWERAEAVRQEVDDAKELVAQQDFDNAITRLEESLNQFPGESQLVEGLRSARNAREAKRRDDAISALCVTIKRQIETEKFSDALDTVDRGLSNYGSDSRLTVLRDLVLAAQEASHLRQREQAIEAVVKQAGAQLELGVYDNALALLERGLQDFDGDRRLADLKATVELEKAAWERHQASVQLVEQSRELISQGEFEKALALLEAGQSSYPGEEPIEEAVRGAREGLAEKQRREETLRRQAIEIEQRELAIRAAYQSAQTQLEKRDFQRALETLDEAQHLTTAFPIEDQGKAGGSETRLADLRETVLTAKADWECTEAVRRALHEANELIEQGAPDKASRLLERALARYPGDSTLLDALVSARDAVELRLYKESIEKTCEEVRRQLDREDFDSALEQLARPLIEHPNEIRLQVLRESILAAKAKTLHDTREIQSALDSAKALSESGRRDEALVLLERSLTDHPANTELVAAIVQTIDAVAAAGTMAVDKVCRSARQYMLTGDFDLAFHTIEQALRLGNEEKQALPAAQSRIETAKASQAGSSVLRDNRPTSSVKEVTEEEALIPSGDLSAEIPVTGDYEVASTEVFHPHSSAAVILPPRSGPPVQGGVFTRWRLLSIAVLVVASMGGIWLARSPKLAVLRVQSSPANATVRVNDQQCSKAPCEFRLKPGQYRIQVSANGFVARTEMAIIDTTSAPRPIDISLKPVSPPPVQASAAPTPVPPEPVTRPPATPAATPNRAFGTLVIQANQADATVFIDGKPYPRLTSHGHLTIQAEANQHIIRMAKDGYQVYPPEIRAELKQDGKFVARFNFVAEPSSIAATRPEPPPAIEPKPDPKAAEQASWQRVAATGNAAQLADFLRNYPDSAHRDEAEARLEKLQLDQAASAREAAWNGVNQTNKLALQQFLAKYGEGSHAQDARSMISAFEKQDRDKQLAAQPPKAPASNTTADSSAVTAALNQFEAAYNRRDIGALQALWSEMPKNTFDSYRNQFRDAKSLQFRLTPAGHIKIVDNRATAVCNRTLRFVAKNGDRPPEMSDRVRVDLERTGSQWTIRGITPF